MEIALKSARLVTGKASGIVPSVDTLLTHAKLLISHTQLVANFNGQIVHMLHAVYIFSCKLVECCRQPFYFM